MLREWPIVVLRLRSAVGVGMSLELPTNSSFEGGQPAFSVELYVMY